MRCTLRCCLLLPLLLSSDALAEETIAPEAAKSANNGSDWPGFLGPHRNGKSDETGLPTTWPEDGPPLIWQTVIGSGHSAPVISNGRLFHFSRFENTARLTCFNAETGAELWRCAYPTDYIDKMGFDNGPRATPEVHGSHVYTIGAEGIFQCVRVTDGQPLWRIDTNEELDVVRNFFGAGSTPLVWRDLLIANIGGSPPGGPLDIFTAVGDIPPNGAAVVAFDRATGKVRWQTGDELASYASPVVSRIGNRDILFVFARGGLVAVNPAEGETIAHFPWRAKQFHSVNAATPIVVGSEVFISEAYGPGGALLQFAGDAFRKVWCDGKRRRDRAMANHWINSIEHEGYLYGTSGYEPSEIELRCVHWSTGEVMWSERETARISMLLVDGRLVGISEDGTLRVIRPNPQRYEELAEWSFTANDGTPLLKYPAWTAPALAHGLLYVRGADRLACFRLIEEE